MARDRAARALERISALRDVADTEVLRGELAAILSWAPGSVVASAARLVAERGIQSLERELAASFARLLDAGAKGDAQCLGKRAVARALVELQCGASVLDVYRAGLHCVQLEPVFGGKVDTAAELRAICARGLVLANPAGSLEFVAGHLDHANAAIAEGAALALGESRAPAALPLLQGGLERCFDPDVQRAFYTAIALLRSDAATDFLIAEIAGAPAQRAAHAVSALGMHRGDGKLRVRIERAAAQRSERPVRDAFQSAFE